MSAVNLKKELQRGALLYRAFEHGLELADKLQSIEEQISGRELTLRGLDENLEKVKTEHANSLKKLDDERVKREAEIIKEIAQNTKEAQSLLEEAEKQLSAATERKAVLEKQNDKLEKEIQNKKEALEKKEEEAKALESRISSAKKKMQDFLHSE